MFPKALRRDILLLLGLKAVALTLIYFFFIAPMIAPEPDGPVTRAHILSDRNR